MPAADTETVRVRTERHFMPATESVMCVMSGGTTVTAGKVNALQVRTGFLSGMRAKLREIAVRPAVSSPYFWVACSVL